MGACNKIGSTVCNTGSPAPAGGGGGQPQSGELEGFTNTTTFYRAAVGVGIGLDGDWVSSVLIRLETVAGIVQAVASATQSFGNNAGWELSVGGTRPQLVVTDQFGPTKLANFVGTTWEQLGTVVGKLVVLHLVNSATQAKLYLNGEIAATIGYTTGFFANAALGLTVGLVAQNLNNQFTGGVKGIGYGEYAMTDLQVALHYRDVVEAGAMVETGAGAFINFWDMAAIDAGVAPATIPDLGTGGNPLTRNGALTVVDRFPINYT